MYQVTILTHDQKVEMYNKCTKQKLIEMIIEANNQIERLCTPYVEDTWLYCFVCKDITKHVNNLCLKCNPE